MPAVYTPTGGFVPNPSPTTLGGVESIAAVSHQWINSISTAGVPSLSQPSFADISGSVVATQLPSPSSTTLGGIQSAAAVTHQWIDSISTAGVPHLSQPSFADLSGSAAVSQLPVMVASGASHAAGIVPDPGVTAGTTHFLREDGAWVVPGGGSGTVTSVTFTGDGTVLSSTPSSAVTTAGTVAASLSTQAKNTVLAGPATGANAAPTFRALGTADLPVLTSNMIYSGRTGTAVTNTTTPTSLLVAITNDVGSLTIPAGALNSVGRMLKVRGYGTVSSTGTAVLTFTLSLGGTTIATGTSVTMAALSSRLFAIDFGYFSTRSTGTTGAFSGFLHLYAVNNSGTGGNAVVFATLAGAGAAPTNATIDLTAAQALDLKVTWNEANASDSIQLLHLALIIEG